MTIQATPGKMGQNHNAWARKASRGKGPGKPCLDPFVVLLQNLLGQPERTVDRGGGSEHRVVVDHLPRLDEDRLLWMA